MASMISFARRGGWVAVVMMMLVFAVGEVGAASRYVISAGSEDSLFTVSKNGSNEVGGVNISIDSCTELIRERSNGDSVEVHLDAQNGGLNVRDKSVLFISRNSAERYWGHITITGKVKGNGNRVVNIYAAMYSAHLDVVNKANIVAESSGRAFYADGDISLTFAACTLSTAGSNAVYATGGWSGDAIVVKGGKYTSKSGYAIYSIANIRIENGQFVSEEGGCVYFGRNIEINGGTFSSNKTTVTSTSEVIITGGTFKSESGNVIEANMGGEISGGTFAATGGGKALLVSGGKVRISGGAEFSTAETDTGSAVALDGGNVVLDGGVIKNNRRSDGNTVGRAINIASAKSTLTFTGTTPPEIKGSIAFRVPNAIYMDVAKTWRSPDAYVLEPLGGARVEEAVAVVNGGAHIGYFKYDNDYYKIERGSNNNDVNIIIRLKASVQQLKYVITSNTATEFTAIEDYSKVTVGAIVRFDSLVRAIRLHANGRPCNLYFGNGGASVDIGTNAIYFGGNTGVDWGRVKLSGKLQTRRSGGERGPVFGLYVTDGASVVSDADINSNDRAGTVYVTTGSDYTHEGGTLSSSIANGFGFIGTSGGLVKVTGGKVPQIISRGNGAEVDISGGTIGDATNNYCAIQNERYSKVDISKTAKIVSADTNYNGGTIVNNGMLEIRGGSVSNVGASYYGISLAILSDDDAHDTTELPEVWISGNAEIFSKSAIGYYGVIRNMWGEMTISEGRVYSTADTVGVIVANYGKLRISNLAEIESRGSYNPSPADGAVYSTGTDAVLEISGGKITAKDGYAVAIAGTGGAIISGDAEITSADPEGAVYIGANAYLKFLGGTVSSTADAKKDTTVKIKKAIDAYEGGRGGVAGRLIMGGSPIVDGIISLPGKTDSIITILAADRRHSFDPYGEIYHIATPAAEKRVILKDGAGFIRNFVLDTTGNAGLRLAVNGDDVVAAKSTVIVSFDLNGSKSVIFPSDIVVMTGGTIGALAKPSTNNYVKTDTVGNVIYMVENDGEWHLHNGTANGFVIVGDAFDFGVDNDGTRVDKKTTLTLDWTGARTKVGTISVLESTRDLPPSRNTETAAVSPVAAASGGLTAGPSPVSGSFGAVNFFWSGGALKGGRLFIYDASGNEVKALSVSDQSGGIGKRSVAAWDLRDARGRQVAEGTYVAKGVVRTGAGKKESVSLLISVQR